MLTKGNIPLGYLHYLGESRNKDRIGDVIPFTELKDYIGKKVMNVLYTSDYDGTLTPWYEVVEITGYRVNSDTFYDYVLEGNKYKRAGIRFVCDHVTFRKKPFDREGQCSVSEAYCSNGRFKPVGQWEPGCFYNFDVE